MRLYISILAAAGLVSVSACSKKDPVAPVQTQVTDKPVEAKTDEAKPVEAKTDEAKTDEAKADEVKAEDPVVPAPVDRTEALLKSLEALSAGDFDGAFAHFADDVVRHNVGNPDQPEVKGKSALIEASRATRATMSDLTFKASRIIETDEVQVVEYVVQGKFKAPGEDSETKNVALAAAMLLEYNDAGQVSAIWSFQDDALVLRQIGALPGLAADYTPVALPEVTQVVKGAPAGDLAAIYNEYVKLTLDDATIDSVAELLAEDFTMVDLNSGRAITKPELPRFLRAATTHFSDRSQSVEREITVGEYLVTVSTMQLTHRVALEEGEPREQKLVATGLEVTRVVDGEIKSLTSYVNGLQVLAAHGVLAGAAEKPEEAADADAEAKAAGGEIGVAACDTYLKTVRECMSHLPQSAQGQFETGISSALESWRQLAAGGDAARSALAQACQQALATSKEAMGKMCPGVTWE